MAHGVVEGHRRLVVLPGIILRWCDLSARAWLALVAGWKIGVVEPN